jgi:hypothetical protein
VEQERDLARRLDVGERLALNLDLAFKADPIFEQAQMVAELRQAESA